MKSAYELAMERLQEKAPSVSFSAEQKAQLAEIDSAHKAKIAERELFLKGEIVKARAKGEAGEAEELQRQLTIDIRRLHEGCEAKKAKLRAAFSGRGD